MSKILFTLEIPDVKIRKDFAPKQQFHKLKNKYTRKLKHRNFSECKI